MEQSTKRNPILLLVILVAILVIAGIAFGNKARNNPANNEQKSAMTEQADQMPPLSESNDTESIEADLESTNFSELDAELK